MRIIISNYDEIKNPYYGGGGAMANHEIAKRLVKKHKIKIICGAYKNCQDRIVEEVEYKHIGIKKAGPLFGQVIFSFLLPLYAMREKYDIWVENFIPPHSTNFIPLFTRKPVIGQTMLLHARKFSQKYKLPFYLIEKIGIKQYKYGIALSEEMKKKILKMHPNSEVQVIPLGIDKKLLDIKTKEDNFFLFMGRLDVFQKGLDLLLKSWAQASKQIAGVKLVIAGTGKVEEKKKLRNLVNKFGINQRVKFVGLVKGKERENLFSHCLFSVCPSRFESFGMSALEALAVGKPLLCFDIKGFKWIPSEICVKVSPFNTGELSKKMTALTQDNELRTKLKITARKFARKYNWDSIADKYDMYLEKIVNQSQL
jgi:glycosyltransferase involved in cell wall biosynthesis